MELEDIASEGTRGSEEHGNWRKRILCRGRKQVAHSMCLLNWAICCRKLPSRCLKVPLGFFLPQEERYILSKELLNKRNQDLRAARYLASLGGIDVTARIWIPSKDQRGGRGGLISKRSVGFYLMG